MGGTSVRRNCGCVRLFTVLCCARNPVTVWSTTEKTNLPVDVPVKSASVRDSRCQLKFGVSSDARMAHLRGMLFAVFGIQESS
jgi:hypothetical protein